MREKKDFMIKDGGNNKKELRKLLIIITIEIIK